MSIKLNRLLWDAKHSPKPSVFLRGIARVAVTFLVIVLRHDIKCKVPFSTTFWHGGVGVVIARNVHLGENCVIGQNVTLGSRKGDPKVPWIGDHVIVCANACVLGDVVVGHHSLIGAGAVVLSSCKPFSVMVGNPAKALRYMDEIEYLKMLEGGI